jgi:hypothetical protein
VLQTVWRTGWLLIEGGRYPRVAGMLFASKVRALTRAHNTGGTEMPDGIRWIGLDVHARESTFAGL